MDKMEFLQGNPQEEGPKRVEKKKAKRRWGWLIVAAVLVVAGVTAAVLWDPTAFDGLRRSIIYASAEKDETGCAQLYHYTSERDYAYASLEGSLVLASANRIVVLGEEDAVRYSVDVKFTKAGVAANEEIAAVYDIGGTEIHVIDSQGAVRQLSVEGEILSCTLNEDGAMAVTFNKSGVKAGVTVFDREGEKVFGFNSGERFLMTAAVSRDSRQMAAVAMGQTEGTFVSSVVIYDLDSDQPKDIVEMAGGAVYDIGTMGGKWCAVGEDALHLIDREGAVLSYGFEGGYLRRCAMGDNFTALVLGRYKTGTQGRIVCVDDEGMTLGVVEVDKEVLSVSAAGKYVAVLYSDELVIYDKTLTVCAQLQSVSAARCVMMRRDGSAVLAGADRASLYLP